MSKPIHIHTTSEYEVRFRFHNTGPMNKFGRIWSSPFDYHEVTGSWGNGVEWSGLCKVCLN